MLETEEVCRIQSLFVVPSRGIPPDNFIQSMNETLYAAAKECSKCVSLVGVWNM